MNKIFLIALMIATKATSAGTINPLLATGLGIGILASIEGPGSTASVAGLTEGVAGLAASPVSLSIKQNSNRL